jgi:predicted secreted hydrolase
VRLSRRAWLLAAPAIADAAAGANDDDAVRAGRVLRFPRDHGAHPGARIEWWYATGWLDAGAAPIGFQVTFFRSRTGMAADLSGRFAPRQLLFAHAAISDIAAGRHRQAQRVARWSGDPAAREAAAATDDTDLRLGRWTMRRAGALDAGRYNAHVGGGDAAFELELELSAAQPLLLQGDAGHSRKGPLPQQASHYYSLPQLRARAVLTRAAGPRTLEGHAWLDHEWSDELLPPDAVGWDWIGINLDDGGALTAFRLRRRDGTPLWAGGSHRTADGGLRVFAPDEVHFAPQRQWSSPASLARYPVQWQIVTPAGRHTLRALMDAQELDGRASNGAVYWEGLSDLFDATGHRAGRGYLEMTGYAGSLRL